MLAKSRETTVCSRKRNFHVRSGLSLRAGAGISTGYYECGLRPLSLKNRRKLEPKETPRCLIPHLLIVFNWQLAILATTVCVLVDTVACHAVTVCKICKSTCSHTIITWKTLFVTKSDIFMSI